MFCENKVMLLLIMVLNAFMTLVSAHEDIDYVETDSDDGNGNIRECEDAHLKCMLRTGCGMALQKYLIGCQSLNQGQDMTYCPEMCRNSLIALTSTEEGQYLIKCRCTNENCKEAKRRLEICRSQVTRATRNDTTVTCNVAQLICATDAQCSTALEYYNHYCRLMLQGRKCTSRCMNSIWILQRQEKAAKLKTCRCNGREDIDCRRVQNYMAKLCFNKPLVYPDYENNEVNTVRIEPSQSCYFSLSGLSLLLSLFLILVFV